MTYRRMTYLLRRSQKPPGSDERHTSNQHSESVQILFISLKHCFSLYRKGKPPSNKITPPRRGRRNFLRLRESSRTLPLLAVRRQLHTRLKTPQLFFAGLVEPPSNNAAVHETDRHTMAAAHDFDDNASKRASKQPRQVPHEHIPFLTICHFAWRTREVIEGTSLTRCDRRLLHKCYRTWQIMTERHLGGGKLLISELMRAQHAGVL